MFKAPKSKVALPLLLAATLYGCMVGPDYERPAAPVPSSFKEAADWKVAQPSDEVPRGNWWEAFGDPDLNALEEQVDISNQTIQAAEARVREASAATQAARSALFPVVSGNAVALRSSRGTGTTNTTATGGNQTVGSVNNSYNLALDASWEIDLWGGIRRGIEASSTTAQATVADLAGAKLSAQALACPGLPASARGGCADRAAARDRRELRAVAAIDAQSIRCRRRRARRRRAGRGAAQVHAGAGVRRADRRARSSNTPSPY